MLPTVKGPERGLRSSSETTVPRISDQNSETNSSERMPHHPETTLWEDSAEGSETRQKTCSEILLWKEKIFYLLNQGIIL